MGRDALLGDDNAHYDDPYIQRTHSKLIMSALCERRRRKDRVKGGGERIEGSREGSEGGGS